MDKIIKYCKCGCGGIPNPGRDYIKGHQRRGVVLSDVTKEKMSESQMGHEVSDVTKKKLSVAQQKRREENPVSDITKEKISESLMGNKNAQCHEVSAVTKEKISESLMGREVSDITKKKLSVANTGMNFPMSRRKKCQ